MKSQWQLQREVLGPRCLICEGHVATRLIVPCGHWAGCIECAKGLVNTRRFFVTIDMEGVMSDEVDLPLPVRCPQCLAIVGKLQRVFWEEVFESGATLLVYYSQQNVIHMALSAFLILLETVLYNHFLYFLGYEKWTLN